MLRVGQEEIDAIAAVIRSGELFRYHEGGECARFEKRWADYVRVRHALMTSSGTTALSAALTALGIGPGDEVLVPSHTYMATAVAVVAAGAIPVIVEIDDSLMLDPLAVEAAIGPRTRAMIPVHMWGLVCDMTALTRIARDRGVLVVEDACQCVGGGYEGRPVGSFGEAGAFSFNYFKNMTCGEGGAVVTNDEQAAKRMSCMIDCCGFYWTGRDGDLRPFLAPGSRASEIEGAMMNVQLDRLPGLLETLRTQKKRILAETADTGLTVPPCRSPEWECATNTFYALPTAEAADRFAELAGGGVTGKTGRHVYTEWDQILGKRGAAHPAMDPFQFPQNTGCRMDYTPEMCPRSLEILSRTVMIGNHPDRTEAQVAEVIERVRGAAREVLG